MTENENLSPGIEMEIKEESEESKLEGYQVGLSLCRSLISERISDDELVEIFNANIINYESFRQAPHEFLAHPDLMIRIHNGLYLPKDGIPQIISLLAFNQELSPLTDLQNKENTDNLNMENEIKENEKSPVLNKMEKIQEVENENSSQSEVKTKRIRRKGLRPNEAMLRSMNLQYGRNVIRYEVTGTMKEPI